MPKVYSQGKTWHFIDLLLDQLEMCLEFPAASGYLCHVTLQQYSSVLIEGVSCTLIKVHGDLKLELYRFTHSLKMSKRIKWCYFAFDYMTPYQIKIELLYIYVLIYLELTRFIPKSSIKTALFPEDTIPTALIVMSQWN